MTEMVCVSAAGRITPGCAGLYKPEHEAAFSGWSILFIATRRPGLASTLGHSGRKGSTRLMWEAWTSLWRPATAGLIAPSPLPVPTWLKAQVPREMTRQDMDLVRDQSSAATCMAVHAAFDFLSSTARSGYLLASFISPLGPTGAGRVRRQSRDRLRFPPRGLRRRSRCLPAEKPMTVRVSGDRRYEGGISAQESIEVSPRVSPRMVTRRDRRLHRPDGGGGGAGVRPQLQTPFATGSATRDEDPDIAVARIAATTT